MTNEEILIRFLKEHRSYASFVRQKDLLEDDFKVVEVRDAIVWNFDMETTVEGFEFWINLHNKFKKMCKDLEISGTIDLEKV